MSFWGEEELKARLKTLISDFSETQIDCNAYTLKVGEEYYVSPTDQTKNPNQITIQQLDGEQSFTIPPGQFAFLITQEIVRIPSDAMAFISIKAKIKFKGLINVSGFHVDPGFHGRLVFAVYNAGPHVVHLRQGQDCFLIWFADVKGASARSKKGIENVNISTDLLNALPGEVQSFEGLKDRIEQLEEKLTERMNRLEPLHASFRTGLAVVTALVLGFLGFYLRGLFVGESKVESVMSSAQSTGILLPTPASHAQAGIGKSRHRGVSSAEAIPHAGAVNSAAAADSTAKLPDESKGKSK